jgi:hypothetical protein
MYDCGMTNMRIDLDYYLKQGKAAAEQAFGADETWTYQVYIAFGSAREPEEEWTKPLGWNDPPGVPLPFSDSGTAFLCDARSASHIVELGPDALSCSIRARYTDYAIHLPPGVKVVTTLRTGLDEALEYDGNELATGLRYASSWGEEHQAAEEPVAAIAVLLMKMGVGAKRRKTVGDGAWENDGEFH